MSALKSIHERHGQLISVSRSGALQGHHVNEMPKIIDLNGSSYVVAGFQVQIR